MPTGPAQHPGGLHTDLDHALDRCADEMRSLDRSVVFLTGGTGFVGSWLLELLTWSADRLHTTPRAVVLTRDPAAFAARRPHLATHRIIDLRRGDVRHSFPSMPADAVIAGASASRASGDAASDADVVETQDRGADVASTFLNLGSRVMFLSSGAAGGGNDAYATAKRRAEQRLTSCSPPAVVARLFTFVGPYLPLDLNFAVGNFLGNALDRRPITVKGDGTSVRTYLYAADLARWLWVILVRGEPGAVYDVGSGEAVTIVELARRIALLVGPSPLPVSVEGRAVGSSATPHYVPDLSNARRLGLEVAWSLDAALQRTWHWAVRTMVGPATGGGPPLCQATTRCAT